MTKEKTLRNSNRQYSVLQNTQSYGALGTTTETHRWDLTRCHFVTQWEAYTAVQIMVDDTIQ